MAAAAGAHAARLASRSTSTREDHARRRLLTLLTPPSSARRHTVAMFLAVEELRKLYRQHMMR